MEYQKPKTLGPPEVPKQPVKRRIGRFDWVINPDGSLMLDHGANPQIDAEEAAELAAFIQEHAK